MERTIGNIKELLNNMFFSIIRYLKSKRLDIKIERGV